MAEVMSTSTMPANISSNDEDVVMVDGNAPDIHEATPADFPDQIIKMEDDDMDIVSEGHGNFLRSLQTNSEARDSPNSSLTSTSMHSIPSDHKPAPTFNPVIKQEVTSSDNQRYLYTKAPVTCRARSSIPPRLPAGEYANQCITAAENSRLDPFKLHEDEHKLLQDKLCQLHVTVYLNIRNGILRLWARNPSVSVSLEEAIGCIKDERWTRLACFAYEWLVRRGYINFGCVAAPMATKQSRARRKDGPAKETIVVIGGGVAGLSTARQLTNLFHHFPDQTTPKVIVLEGRSRIGGRIYSHPLTSMRSSILTPEQRATAEMGAHIIVGFEKGNPLDAIIRGQLALNYHLLRDLSTLYDVDGSPVNGASDAMIERLYNDVLDRTGEYRVNHTIKKTAEGDKEMIEAWRDPPPNEESVTIKQYEEATADGTIDLLLPTKKSRRRGAGHKAAKGEQSKEEVDTDMATKKQLPAAQAAKEFGFMLRKTTQLEETLQLDNLASKPNASLGSVMNAGIEQYQQFLDLKPYALRLINWHFANLEYANACNVDKLSLRAWDQDIGNEFEGEHAQVVGGYQQFPRALWRYPEALDVRTNKPVQAIHYGAAGLGGKPTVVCEDGEAIEADRVVFSAPLGVLKEQAIKFDPPLPQWKADAIKRMGFGLLNKLIMVFEKPFWDTERDMFGLLRAPRDSAGQEQANYKQCRGQFYLFWNCIDTSGLPVLIALMAGEAAHEAERTPDAFLVEDCLHQLRNVFGHQNVPSPVESIVTRWGSDRFARGTYSYVAAEAKANDYDTLAAPISNTLFFAGEATIATHPATVHGAYLSGLRAAHEVYESLVGPIAIPSVLVPPPSTKSSIFAPAVKAQTTTSTTIDLTEIDGHLAQQPKRKGDEVLPAGTFTRPMKENNNKALQEAWDAAMWVRIYNDLGPPPVKPPKLNINAFLLFSGEHWDAVKQRLADAKAAAAATAAAAGKGHWNKGRGKQTERDQVRVELGKMWASLDEEGKKPYTDTVARNREENDRLFKEWSVKAAAWDKRTWEVKDVWVKEGNSFEEFVERRRVEEMELDKAREGL
ncbi:Lysine-specific histone demethylase 1A [Cyphellophora attinorum]|uniref:Lysine-specific histone demethylase 1A n=1 Tax=Cyphellophora attinorum TaxID=1664694 RepID=A0A0N0NIT8_9EURO|nr:Lysine-specific histone demethylase 1A [Phialophora attinorum]KPI36211.1 Lysine-specific histone demethylase 1A [Phialophora attinorum]